MKTSESASVRWARIIRQQEASGLSIAGFCRRRGVSPVSFYAWRRRFRSGGVETPAFVELKVGASSEEASATDGAALELLLPGGSRVLVRRGFDGATLRELLSVLGASA